MKELDTSVNLAAENCAQFQKLCDSLKRTIPTPPRSVVQFKNFSQQYKSIITDPITKSTGKVLENFQEQLRQSFSSAAQESYSRMMKQFQEHISEAFSEINSDYFKNHTAEQLSRIRKKYVAPQLLLMSQKDILSTKQTTDTVSDDYVILSEDDIKEYELPDTIAIPLPGKRRFKMRTDHFIALLSILITLLIAICASSKSENSASSEDQIIIENYFSGDVYNLLNNVDYTNSSLVLPSDIPTASETATSENLPE